MFLRKNRKKSNGEVYEYWTLCETVRTELGPRQRVVATPGKLSEEDLAARTVRDRQTRSDSPNRLTVEQCSVRKFMSNSGECPAF